MMKKDNKVLVILLGVIVGIALICGYNAMNNPGEVIKTDAIKMKEEYEALNGTSIESIQKEYPSVSLGEDNPYVYKTEEEIVNILENKTGIIYLGFPGCPWCRNMVGVLASAAKAKELSTIYYLDIKGIRDTYKLDSNNKLVQEKEGSASYYKMLKILDKYLDDYVLTTKDGKSVNTKEKRILAPSVIAVKDGKVVDFHAVTVESHKNGFDLLDEKQKKELQDIYESMIAKTQEGICTEGC